MAKGWFSDICRNLGLMVHNTKNPEKAVLPTNKPDTKPYAPDQVEEKVETKIIESDEKVILRRTTQTITSEEIEMPVREIQQDRQDRSE